MFETHDLFIRKRPPVATRKIFFVQSRINNPIKFYNLVFERFEDPTHHAIPANMNLNTNRFFII